MLFGLMGWTGISLNVSTGMIAAIAIGIAVDDTIHYLNRFNKALRATGSVDQAAVEAMQAVGKPMIITSTAVAAGFLVVCLSNFEPIRHFGYLASATMVLAVISDLFVTPAVAAATKLVRN
jgi:predicted RND superfamily exporter protein